MHDLARERYRRDGRRARHAAAPSPGAPAMVVQVFQQTTLPTTTGVFYACHPCTVFGAEAEGTAGTGADGFGGLIGVDASTTVFVYAVGSKAPAAGDYLVAHFLGNRWVAERMTHSGTGPITIPGCPCTDLPTSLGMTSSDHVANGGMFQDDTLVWQPCPSWFPTLDNGDGTGHCYLGAGTWTDSSSGDLFQYYFRCFSGFYALSRVYQTSIFGSPFEDSIRYKWFVGLPNNTCGPPVALHNGTIFSGGDPSSVVHIDG